MALRDITAKVNQVTPSVLSDGDQEEVLQGKVLGLWTADWKVRLAAAGKLWRLSVGTLSSDTGVTRVTGGGAGTTVDLDEPEIAIGCPTGYYLIPIEIHVSGVLDQDANAELGEIVVTMDRTQIPAGVTGTTATLYNQLDGAATYPGVAYHTVTVVTTNPTNEELIAVETVSSSEFVSNGAATNLTNGVVTKLQLDWIASYPDIVAGPCTLLVYWGGTAAVTALATVVVGCVPAAWFPVS